jgi:hypothetical protein
VIGASGNGLCARLSNEPDDNTERPLRTFGRFTGVALEFIEENGSGPRVQLQKRLKKG